MERTLAGENEDVDIPQRHDVKKF